MLFPGYLSLLLLFESYLFDIFESYLLRFSRSSTFIHAGLLVFFHDFLFVGVLFFSLEETILEYHPLGTSFHGTLPSKSLVRPKSALLKPSVVSLLCVLLAAPRILNSSVPWSLQPRLSLSFTFLTSTNFLVRQDPTWHLYFMAHLPLGAESCHLWVYIYTCITYTCIHWFFNRVRNYALQI